MCVVLSRGTALCLDHLYYNLFHGPYHGRVLFLLVFVPWADVLLCAEPSRGGHTVSKKIL